MKIRFITVGGTIDKIYFDQLSEFQVGTPGIERLLHELPLAFDYIVESLVRKDSLDMTDEDRILVVEAVSRSLETHIVITHGTDTMIQTAKCLATVSDKIVVLTGAMQPAGFQNSDAAFNIGTAIGAVNALPSGIYIAMNGRIFDPQRTRKNRERGMFEPV
jgi:L-asparaginase